MKKWEYTIASVEMNEKWSSKKQEREIVSLEERINGMGAEGWEMISYESIPLIGTITGNLKGYAYLVFFKREVSGN